MDEHTTGSPPGDGTEGGSSPSEPTESLHRLAAVLARKWHLVIIYHLMVDEPLRFSDLQRRIDGIADKVLAENLETLENHRLVERTVLDERPLRVEYTLTERGESFRPLVEAVAAGQFDFL